MNSLRHEYVFEDVISRCKTDWSWQAFAGIGGGGMTTVVSIMMSDIVPLRQRGTWQGIINIIYASGAGCGAPLGIIPISHGCTLADMS